MSNQKGCIGCLGALILIAIIFFGVVINQLLTTDTASEQEEETQVANAPAQDSNKTEEPKKEESTKLITATVTSITDGDTLKVDIDGKKETIRLILVDTPETKHPKTGVQPFGPEATKFTTEQLSGKEIQIEPGIEERDRYGRLLAYVYIGDKMFNKMLVKEGLARVAVYPPNTKYLDEFEQLQEEAKQKEIGIWSIENYATEDGYKTEEKEQQEPTTPSKPEIETTLEPEQEPKPTVTIESYKNCTELRKVHPDGVPSSHPAYDKKHDRDGDNWACER